MKMGVSRNIIKNLAKLEKIGILTKVELEESKKILEKGQEVEKNCYKMTSFKNNKLILFLDNKIYLIDKLLGSGTAQPGVTSSPSIFNGIDLESGKNVAIKEVYSDGEVEDINKEHNNLKTAGQNLGSAKLFNDPMIKQPWTQGNIVIMPKVEGPHLQKFLDDKTLSVEEVSHIAIQIIKQIEKLHKKGLIHADIKPDNIHYDKKNGKAVLIDFGESVTKKDQSPFEDVATDTVKLDVGVGTALYTISNVEAKLKSAKTDTYALGITVAQLYLNIKSVNDLAHGKEKLDATLVRDKIIQKLKERIEQSDKNSPEIQILELVIRMMSIVPDDRPTLQECIKVMMNATKMMQSISDVKFDDENYKTQCEIFGINPSGMNPFRELETSEVSYFNNINQACEALASEEPDSFYEKIIQVCQDPKIIKYVAGMKEKLLQVRNAQVGLVTFLFSDPKSQKLSALELSEKLESLKSAYAEYCVFFNTNIKWPSSVSNIKIVPPYDLPSILIMPIQRSPRYQLLGKDFYNFSTKYGNQISQEFAQALMAGGQKIAEFINEKRREKENMQWEKYLDVFRNEISSKLKKVAKKFKMEEYVNQYYGKYLENQIDTLDIENTFDSIHSVISALLQGKVENTPYQEIIMFAEIALDIGDSIPDFAKVKVTDLDMKLKQYQSLKDTAEYCLTTRSLEKKHLLHRVMTLLLEKESSVKEYLKSPHFIQQLLAHKGTLNVGLQSIGISTTSGGYKLAEKLFDRYAIDKIYLSLSVSQIALLNAVYQKQYNNVNQFIQKNKFNINDALATDEKGCNVLHYLMQSSDENAINAIVNILRKSVGYSGIVNFDIPDHSGATPHDYLMKNENKDKIIEAITEAKIKGYYGFYKIEDFFPKSSTKLSK